MTFIAQQVLEDAKYVCDKLGEHPTGTEWRVMWTSGVSMLRSIGYALRNRDLPEEKLPERQAYKEWWTRLKNDHSKHTKIWHDFIDYERHNVLKEYRSSVAECQATYMALGMNIVISNDKRASFVEAEENQPTINGIQVRHKMIEGPYKGRDAVELFNEAINWLESEIGLIEERIHEIQKSNE